MDRVAVDRAAQVPLNDLARTYTSCKPGVDAAVMRVLASGWYVHGKEHDAFETDFAEYVQVHHCVGVANGTDALALALIAAGAIPGDEIVTAANAGMYATSAALSVGLDVRFADVDADTLTLSAETIDAVVGPATKVVVVTHLYGQLADMRPIAALCRARGLVLVEDCAQSIGATRDGLLAGAWGDLATFSFYPTKNLGAVGDGGAVVTNDAAIAKRLRALRQYGWEVKYCSVVPGGRNSRLDELQAAVLRFKLASVDGWNRRRREIVARYRRAAPDNLRVVGSAGEDFVAHLCVVVTDDRENVRRRLAERGVATAVHYPIPDHRQPVLAQSAAAHTSLPVTEHACAHVLSLPCFPELTEDEIDIVCGALESCCR